MLGEGEWYSVVYRENSRQWRVYRISADLEHARHLFEAIRKEPGVSHVALLLMCGNEEGYRVLDMVGQHTWQSTTPKCGDRTETREPPSGDAPQSGEEGVSQRHSQPS
jgi:hypothetical protein